MNSILTETLKAVLGNCWIFKCIYLISDVYKGRYKNQDVAIKELKDKERAGQAFLKEASVMTWVIKQGSPLALPTSQFAIFYFIWRQK